MGESVFFFFFPFFFGSWRQAETEAGVQEHEQQYLLAATGTQASKQSAKVEECRPAVMGVEIQWRQTKKEKKRKGRRRSFSLSFLSFPVLSRVGLVSVQLRIPGPHLPLVGGLELSRCWTSSYLYMGKKFCEHKVDIIE